VTPDAWVKIGRIERGRESLKITLGIGGREIHGLVSTEDADSLYLLGTDAPITFDGKEIGFLRQSKTGKAVVLVCDGFPNVSGSWEGFERLITHDHGPDILLATKLG
jgi:hypothetical protein